MVIKQYSVIVQQDEDEGRCSVETRCENRAVLPLAIVVELVITSEGNQRSKAYSKRVKDLRRSSNPDLK